MMITKINERNLINRRVNSLEFGRLIQMSFNGQIPDWDNKGQGVNEEDAGQKYIEVWGRNWEISWPKLWWR